MARVIAVGDKAFGSGEFKPIPVGVKLRGTIFDIEETTSGPGSKNPGAPQFVYTVKISADEDYEWLDPETNSRQYARGREIRYNYVPLDGNADNAWVLVAFAEAVGWKADKDTGVSVPEDLTDVLGTEVTVKIGQRTNRTTNAVYNQVSSVSKVSKKPVEAKKSWDQL